MEMIADILLVFGALGATFYCFVLARRLSRFTDLEHGVGGAVAVLSAQVDDLTKALEAAQQSATMSVSTLGEMTQRAELVSGKLELLVASLHDVTEKEDQQGTPIVQDAPLPEPVFVRHGRSFGSALT